MNHVALLSRSASAPPAPASAPPGGRVSLAGMNRESLGAALLEAGCEPKSLRMRTAQLWRWIYVRGVRSFDSMTNVDSRLRGRLAERFTLERGEIADERIAEDGTRKWLLRFPDGGAGRPVEIETVHIPEESRGTLCVSSQVGCTLSCSFCRTGTQRLARNLTCEEMVSQILVARDRLGDYPDPKGAGLRKISNLVMMGMGEPLYNFEAVRDALLVASDGEGLSLSKRRITLSTAGVVPQIARAGREIGCMLAISLHAVTDELRDQLVPLNRKYPISELLAACRNYPGLSNAKRITFEYVMLAGVNDSPSEARELVRLLRGIPSKVNLIPFNSWPGASYSRSTDSAIERFAAILNDSGYASPVRSPRGEDILAACGQLRSQSQRVPKRLRESSAFERIDSA